MNYDKAFAERMKRNYPPGTRIELISMEDPYAPVPPGTRGTVIHVDDIGTLHMAWDNGRSLGVVPGEDNFRKLTPEEIEAENKNDPNMKYVDKLNKDVFGKVNWAKMKSAYKTGDMTYPTDVLKQMSDAFYEVNGNDVYLNDNAEMVIVPGVVKAQDGNIYPALLTIDCQSSGEHWGTTFITPDGVLDDQSEVQSVRDAVKKIGTYDYWYVPYYQGDCHIDWNKCPDEAFNMLEGATGESYRQEGGITY